MTLICCPIAIDSPSDLSEALACANEASEQGARLIEWRIDGLADDPDAVQVIEALLEQGPLPAIITCRSSREGGSWSGDETDRVSLLERIGVSKHPPRYLDFELADYLRSANIAQKIDLVVSHDRQARDVSTGLILSSHDFDGRPRDLTRRVTDMAMQSSCAISKIVWSARSLRDNLEAFDLLRDRANPTIALCMGEFGGMSRVLAPKFGGFLTFAPLDDDDETAPGQISIRTLKETYRFDAIKPSTKVYGIIGWPVGASWSPSVHNAGFDAIDHDGVYLRLAIAPGWEPFKATLGALIDHDGLDFSGGSVTMPHKEHLVRFVREAGGTLDSVSERCGAANTLVVGEDRSLRAINTDAPAAVGCLVEAMEISTSELAGRRVMVLGAGGVARAVVAGLLEHGAEVTVVNRTHQRAVELVEDLSDDRLHVGSFSDLETGGFSALVNATSVGSPAGDQPDASPIPDGFSLDASITVLDTVYSAMPTPLVIGAMQNGCRTAAGGSMFLRQAELQFEIWTGQPAPEGVMTGVLLNSALGS